MGMRVLKTVVNGMAALVSFAAYANYTATTNEGAVAFVNDSGVRATVTDSYLAADGIQSLSFNSTSGGFDFKPTQPSTYTGGTTIAKGQVYVYSDGALGPGPIMINDASSLIVRGCETVFGSKVTFSQNNSYVTGFEGGRPILTSVGSIGAEKSIRIGRSGAGDVAMVVLSLTGGDSEALGRIYTSGRLDLTIDGGTIAVRSDALSPFFKSATDADAPAATVTTAGVTFDVASGADVELGLSPVIQHEIVTNVLDVVAIPNGGFESSLSGWNIDSGTSIASSGVRTNGSDFDTSGDVNWGTTNTSHYLMLRVNHKLSRTINVPSDGLWRIVFDQGCRPGENEYSLRMDTVVKVGTSGTTTFRGPTAKASRYGFKRFDTNVMELSAGDYVLEVSLEEANAKDSYKSMNFDVFRMERVEILDVIGRFTKTGGGILRTEAWTNAVADIEAGVFKVESGDICNTAMSVHGGTLEFVDAWMRSGSQIDVSAEGVLAFSSVGRENLVVNGSFEADGQRTDNVAMNPAGWSVGKSKETDLNVNGSGLQGNGGNVTSSGPFTTSGTVTVYLREDSTLSQTVSVAAAGKYRFSFSKACRDAFYSTTMPLEVTVDGVSVLTSSGSSAAAFERVEVDVDLAAGEHTVVFATGEPSTRVSDGAMVFIDDVRLNPIKTQGEMDAGVIDMASGSTLRLDNVEKVSIWDFRVDGARVRGGRAAVTAAGVNVVGSGSLHVGYPSFTVVFR